MMLDYLGEKGICLNIRQSIADVIVEGKVRTYDMMKMQGKPEVLQNGAVSTVQMADAIIAKLKK
jgi:3-isopropylmalate dehydrogenase